MGEISRIENEKICVEVSTHGAELVRIYDKVRKREVLWNAAPEIWPRYAPVLFPFVGGCYQGQYRHEGTAYPMTGHGFARDMEFRLMDEHREEIWHMLEDTEQTRQVFPFPFQLQIGHEIFDRTIRITWIVENTGTEEMYFSIGAHPAFRMPEGVEQKDCGLLFEKEELEYILLSPEKKGADIKNRYQLKTEDGFLLVGENRFDKDALIFEGTQIEKITLTLPGKVPYVTVSCSEFPFMGIWSKPGAGFLCIEPWYGRCDEYEYAGELKDKTGVNCLAPGKKFCVNYQITVHE